MTSKLESMMIIRILATSLYIPNVNDAIRLEDLFSGMHIVAGACDLYDITDEPECVKDAIAQTKEQMTIK